MKRTINALCCAFFLAFLLSCSGEERIYDTTEKNTDTTTVDAVETVNEWTHSYLKEYYLWNDEYAEKITSPDYTKDYDDFLTDNLMSLTTNTLDKKLYSSESGDYYTLFSYIEQLAEENETKSRLDADAADKSYTNGILNLQIVGAVQKNATQYVIEIMLSAIAPGSPADEAGLQRGDMITLVDGKELIVNTNASGQITGGAGYETTLELLYPEGVDTKTITYLRRDYDTNEQTEHTATVTSRFESTNPMLFSNVREIDNHRIGYLAYYSFQYAYDDELYDVMKTFKAEGVTDLVLDLRYNLGGAAITSNMLSTCIAGEAARDKVFCKYRFNADRMKKYTSASLQDKFSVDGYDYVTGKSLADGLLGLTKVYVLVSGSTASASEVLINALRGIDIEVVLIGEQTLGKNVGMEYTEKTVDGHTYRLVPITFQIYNAKDYSDYEDGFSPDVEMTELQPYEELGDNVIFVYRQWAAFNETNKYLSEPLYLKAVEMITGKEYGTLETTETKAASAVNKGVVTPVSTLRPANLGDKRPFGSFGFIEKLRN